MTISKKVFLKVMIILNILFLPILQSCLADERSVLQGKDNSKLTIKELQERYPLSWLDKKYGDVGPCEYMGDEDIKCEPKVIFADILKNEDSKDKIKSLLVNYDHFYGDYRARDLVVLSLKEMKDKPELYQDIISLINSEEVLSHLVIMDCDAVMLMPQYIPYYKKIMRDENNPLVKIYKNPCVSLGRENEEKDDLKLNIKELQERYPLHWFEEKYGNVEYCEGSEVNADNCDLEKIFSEIKNSKDSEKKIKSLIVNYSDYFGDFRVRNLTITFIKKIKRNQIDGFSHLKKFIHNDKILNYLNKFFCYDFDLNVKDKAYKEVDCENL